MTPLVSHIITYFMLNRTLSSEYHAHTGTLNRIVIGVISVRLVLPSTVS